MYKKIIFLTLIAISSVSNADIVPNLSPTFAETEESKQAKQSPLKAVIDTSTIGSSQLDIKRAIIRELIQHNWEITEHSEKQLLAQYHKKAQLKVTIKESLITFEKVDNKERFKRKWLKSLEKGVIRTLILFSHEAQAKAFLDTTKPNNG